MQIPNNTNLRSDGQFSKIESRSQTRTGHVRLVPLNAGWYKAKHFANRSFLKVPRIYGLLDKYNWNWRFFPIIIACFFLLAVLIVGSLSTSSAEHGVLPLPRLTTLAIWYAFSVLIAFLFFFVGAVIWLYARQRRVAVLLFGFCCMMMLTFASIMGVSSGSSIITALGSSCSALAVPLLTALLLFFPDDMFARTVSQPILQRFLQCYLVLNVLGSLFSTCYSLLGYLLHLSFPFWYSLLDSIYFVMSVAGVVLIVIISSRHITSMRTRQQFRLFLNGILLSFLPILILTLIPTLLNSPFVVNGETSMFFLICFPLTLGYAVLRYQILILDTYIRRYISWMTGAILLSILIYIVTTGCSVVFGNQSVSLVIVVTLLLPVPAIWLVKKTNTLTERFFFSEMLHYRELVDALPLQISGLHLTQVSRALTAAARDTFASPAACIFVLDEVQSCYELFPASIEKELREQDHSLLLALRLSLPQHTGQQAFSIAADLPLIAILRAASRPLLLHELLADAGTQTTGMARYFALNDPHSAGRNPLFIPLRVQDTMVALLLLDERGDHEPYAGPDFEGMNLLLSRFLPLFETAWLTQELQASNVRLRTANERLSELDILKNHFITSTSHELRTPLTSVSGYIDLLLEHGTQLTHEQHDEFLQKAAVACTELVEQVTVISDAGRLHFELKQVTLNPCSLNEMIVQATEIMGVEALHQQRTMHVDLPGPITVLASAHHVCEVLLNLLNNAFKYSEHGTPISIRVLQQTDSVTISVQDAGFGVPPDAQTYLFEQFVRLERDMNSPIRGAGLGLAICKQLVEAMGGRIWLTSSGIPGEGSTFSFTLKLSHP